MKITKSQLKQVIKEELEEAYGRHELGAIFDPQGEPEIASPYRKKPKRSYGSSMTDAEREAAEKRRDPHRQSLRRVGPLGRRGQELQGQIQADPR